MKKHTKEEMYTIISSEKHTVAKRLEMMENLVEDEVNHDSGKLRAVNLALLATIGLVVGILAPLVIITSNELSNMKWNQYSLLEDVIECKVELKSFEL